MTRRVLHLYPDSARDPDKKHLGSTKGFEATHEYLCARGFEYEALAVPRSNAIAREQIRRREVQAYHAVIVETNFAPSVFRYLRKAAPHVRRILISHNAEFPHRMDYIRAEGLSKGTARALVARTLADYLCGRWADYVMPYSPWDLENYWARFTDRRKLKWFAYFLPDAYAETLPQNVEKRAQCVCLLSTTPNAVIVDAAQNFANVVERLGARSEEWKFLMTGDAEKFAVPTPNRIRWTGFLETPYDVLAESRAMALLSDYGYGFKTKILEAILVKTYCLVSPGLYRRQPAEVLPYCLEVDPRSPDSFANALERCETSFPSGDPNAAFREQTFAAFDSVLT